MADEGRRAARAAAAERRPPLAGTVAVTVVSRSHLPFARVLADTLRAAEPGMPLRAVVADLEPGEPVDLPGVEIVAAAELGAAPFRWMALQHTPSDLCCAVKPFAVAHALDCGAARVVYLDADVEVHGPLASLLAPLEASDWTVVPHQRRPFPAEPADGVPSQDDLDRCGELNAGLFAVRAGARSRAFLVEWCGEVSAHGAFLDGWRGGRTEQQLFARVLEPRWNALRLADPGHDVAYWNLHERPLAEEAGIVTAGSSRLATFHWSGFDPDVPARLSRYDSRHPLGRGDALDRLADRYRRALVAAGWTGEPSEWRWDRLPSGAPVDHRVRALCRRYETELDAGDDPWSPAGERRLARALLAPRPRTGTLLPLLAVPLWDERADLRDAYPEAPLSPGRFLGWFERHGAAEHGYLRWVELARDGRASPFERTPLELAREVWSARADLRAAYPRPAGADAERFARWTADYGRAEHALPAECAAAVAAAPAAAARVAARATRHAAERPVEETARELLARGVARGELGLDDVVAWLWSGDSGIAREPRSAG